MKTIKRTFEVTTITATIVNVENGVVVSEDIDETITTFDKVTEKNAAKVFLKNVTDPDTYKGKTIVITSAQPEKVTFAMSAEDFMKYGHAVEGETADDFRAE